MLYLLSQVKITLNIYIFMFLKDTIVVLQSYVFLGFFTNLVTIAAPHLKILNRVCPSIILTQQPFWSKKLRFGRLKVWFGTKAAKIGDFGHLNVMFGH